MIILSALAGGLVYLGLAVLGWGGFAAFFAHPARLALAAVLFVFTATALFSQGNLSAGEREDRGNRWVIGAVGLIGLVSAYVPAYTDRTDFWTLDGDILRWIASSSSLPGACCASGRCSSLAAVSAGLSPSSAGTCS